MSSSSNGRDGTPGGTYGGSWSLVTDPYDYLPGVAPLRPAAQAGDWPAVRAFFNGLDSADQVSYASGLLSDIDGVEGFLERAVAELPHDPLPRTLLARRYIGIGWGIRSAARAKHVSRDQFDRFHAWLRKAEQILIEVCAEQPAYAPAWTARLITARGLELGQAEARRRYDRLSGHHPHHYRAQLQLLQQVCPKWSGSWDDAHGFARECATRAPDGAVNAALVAEAHIEHWLDLDSGADTAYLRGLPVRDDLRFAAQVSVLHRDHRPDWNTVGAHSTFAMAFSLGGHFEDAAPHFAALGNTVAKSPWDYLPDWRNQFTKFRKSALATL
ncbi:hypothetical protein [Streptomyces sp. NPDC002265]|uniref:hypothetical protein n=1 Tax=Streptomyces sp. NPDC002265 TaxID=3154415 RepID=UPI00332AD0BD